MNSSSAPCLPHVEEDDDDDLDDVPLTLLYETRYLEQQRERHDDGNDDAASRTAAAAGTSSRPSALRLGLALGPRPATGKLESSFARTLGPGMGLPDAENIPSPPDTRPSNGTTEGFELSFNAIAATPCDDQPPPTTRPFPQQHQHQQQQQQQQRPSFSLALPIPGSSPHVQSHTNYNSASHLHEPGGAASPPLPTSMHASPPSSSSSPMHAPPPPPPSLHPHPASHLRPPSSDPSPAPQALASTKTLTHTLKPPRLHLENPATASPVVSPLHTTRIRSASAAAASASLPHPGISFTNLIPPPGPPQPHQAKSLLVSILTPAFSIPQPTPAPAASSSQPAPHPPSSSSTPRNRSPVQAATTPPPPPLAQLISASLGIRQPQLRCFSLTEVPLDQLSTSTSSSSHVAVLVDGSSFSLASLEEMLRMNQQLVAGQEGQARTMGCLQADFKAAAASGQEHAVRCGVLEKELEHAAGRAAAAEAEAAALRAALRRCDEQRVHFRGMLAALRESFERSSRTWVRAVGGEGSGEGPGASHLGGPGCPGPRPGAGGEEGIDLELMGLSLEPAEGGGMEGGGAAGDSGSTPA